MSDEQDQLGLVLTACSRETVRAILSDMLRWQDQIDTVVIESNRAKEHEQVQEVIDAAVERMAEEV